ncbi:MAG: RluA family pseudouridine synthase, partial [Nitrospira sp.]|nr:RluA family pseudouridine synthase [Nitrospira sp.]
VELAIGRDAKERKKFSPRTARPKPSATQFRVAERIGKLATRAVVVPKTGRTHQIRVHLASLGHPLLGDPTYGGGKVRNLQGIMIPRVMLHARTLGFVHPTSGGPVEFVAPLPADMQAVLDQLRARASTSRSTHP